jgi:hypothetical protein
MRSIFPFSSDLELIGLVRPCGDALPTSRRENLPAPRGNIRHKRSLAAAQDLCKGGLLRRSLRLLEKFIKSL